ncbi:hypothetical protein A3L12_07420 [Thermococcus sp. P6]|nr:hypothetical protein A3L12_07420 [Thermococcus sp. P6]
MEWESTERELKTLVDDYDRSISDAGEKFVKTGFELQSEEILNWDGSSRELLEMAKEENDPESRALILNDLAMLRYHELTNMRTLAGIGALERSYWENATTGEPIEPFYSMRGTFFYVSGKGVEKLDRAGIVERMKTVRGYEMESIEIYHFGTGSWLRAIREGGRTVSHVVSIRTGTKNGFRMKAVNGTGSSLRLIDPETGKTVMKIAPDKEGVYFVPPVDTTLIGMADDEGFCYKKLPMDTHTLTTIPEGPDEPLVCPSPQVAPFIFDPTGDEPGPVPLEDAYLLPGKYRVTTLVMKADLKELAEQLVNLNMRVGDDVLAVETPTRAKKALDAFQDAITKSYPVKMTTPAEPCSCTVSPLLKDVFGRTFGGPFDEVPKPKVLNITLGNGPYIPVNWEKLENQSSTIVVYTITDSSGDTLIAIGDEGVKQGTKKPTPNRLAANYLDRVYLEVFTGRNAAGEEIRVIAFKVLNPDGTVGFRTTTITKNDVRVSIMESPVGEIQR